MRVMRESVSAGWDFVSTYGSINNVPDAKQGEARRLRSRLIGGEGDLPSPASSDDGDWPLPPPRGVCAFAY